MNHVGRHNRVAGLEFKEFKFTLECTETKSNTDGTKTYCGYASTYNRDSYDDRVVYGAFKETIEERFYKAIEQYGAPDIKIYREHNQRPGQTGPVAVLTFIEERQGEGLYVEWKFLDNTRGRDAQIEVDAGAVNKLSIGYRVTEKKNVVDPDGVQVRLIVKCVLYEWSLVEDPGNDECVVLQKSADHELETKEGDDTMKIETKTSYREKLTAIKMAVEEALSFMDRDGEVTTTDGDQPDNADVNVQPDMPGGAACIKAANECTKCGADMKMMCPTCAKKSEDVVSEEKTNLEEKSSEDLKNSSTEATKAINSQLAEMTKSLDAAMRGLEVK